MADLHSIDFALIPSPVRKEKQFRLPDDLFDLILSRTSHSAFGFPALIRVFTSRVDRCSAIRKINLVPRSLVDEAEGGIWPNPICIT